MGLGSGAKADLRRFGVAIGFELGSRLVDWLGDVTLPRAPIRQDRRERRRRDRDWDRVLRLYTKGAIAIDRYQDLVAAWNSGDDGVEVVRLWLDGNVAGKALDGLLSGILKRGA